MKKVLVTGASGFIGRYVIEELLRKGYRVIATSVNKEKASLQSWFDRVIYIDCDLKDFDDATNYFGYFNEPDALVHLAWEGLPNYKEEFHVKENLPRHFKFLKNLLQNGLKDITVIGTCLEYGMREGCLSESMQCTPGNPYAVAKNELRTQLEELSGKMNFTFKWIRLFYIYGKGQSANSLFSQLDRALADNNEVFNMSGGKQVRDYLPVEKVAEYIVSIATQHKITGIINCCSGIPVTVKQFVQNYLEHRNKSIQLNLGYYPYTDYEPMSFWGDNEKLKVMIESSDQTLKTN